MIGSIRRVSELVEIAGGEDVPDAILASWCGKKFRPERVAAPAAT